MIVEFNSTSLPYTIHHQLCNRFGQTVKIIDMSRFTLKRAYITFMAAEYHSAVTSRQFSDAQCNAFHAGKLTTPSLHSSYAFVMQQIFSPVGR
jgi:hypothetical protein